MNTFISNEIGSLTDEKLKEAVHLVAKIAIINYAYEVKEPKEKKMEFIRKRINRLEKKIIPLILIEIINICFNKDDKNKVDEDCNQDEEENENENKIKEEEDKKIDYKELKDEIFEKFSKKLDNENDIDNIINLIDCLEGKEKKKKDEEKEEINEFFKKLMNNHLFTKDEFFSGSQNLKILLFYKLKEKGKIKKSEEDYYENITKLLKEINTDIDGNIKKSKLEEFLKNEETFIIQRLSLINLLIDNYKPKEKYESLKKINDNINKEINKLKYIKENYILYFKDSEQDKIKKIIEVIKNNQNKRIIEYKGGRIGEIIQGTKNLEEIAEKINHVKNFLLFKVIYEMNLSNDESKNFDIAYDTLEEIGRDIKEKDSVIELNNKYNKIFRKIKEKLSNNEEEANKFIENLKNYYQIDKTNLIDELTILFKSKKYELDINSIIFFFENYFQKDNKDWNDKMPPTNYIDKWENFENIKNDLNRLKENKIYDYQNIGNYNKLFTCLYDKKEAIDFLFKKTSKEILKLKDNIQPTDRTINIKDINDTEKCVFVISKMKSIKDNFQIFDYIQKLEPSTISQFENYSKIYSSVIELDSNDDNSEESVYSQVIKYVKNSTLNILQDTENLLYFDENNVMKKMDKNIMEEFVHLKNQIHIKNEKESSQDETMKSKFKILIFFKETVSNLESINEYMKILRKKGSSLPIKIIIDISIKDKEESKEPTIKYYLVKDKEEEYDYTIIRQFLFEAKNAYISQISSIYKEKLNLRFLYGKQFRSMMKHLEDNYKIDSFLRYIINNTDNNIPIKEGYKSVKRNV